MITKTGYVYNIDTKMKYVLILNLKMHDRTSIDKSIQNIPTNSTEFNILSKILGYFPHSLVNHATLLFSNNA